MTIPPYPQPRFSFDMVEIEKMEKSYSEVNLSDYQRKTSKAIAAIHANNLGINEVAVRGFINYATRDWQEESKMLAEEYYKLSKNEQIAALWRIAEFFFQRMSKIVPEKQHKDLQKSIMEAHHEVMKRYKL